MNSEIEAKFLYVDHDALRQKLQSFGAEQVKPLSLMRRTIFHGDALGKDAYVRVRDEGNKIVITYKSFDDENSMTGVREAETEVGDFDVAVMILEQTGLSRDAYQETKRETWRLDDVEIMLDEWPWLPPFIEIEGPSEEAVKATAAKLGFAWQDAVIGAITKVYAMEYPALGDRADEIVNRQTPIIRFEDSVPAIFEARVD